MRESAVVPVTFPLDDRFARKGQLWARALRHSTLEVEARRRLVQSMRVLWSAEVEAEGTSRVTWEIEPVGDSCRLLVTHDQLREGANEELYSGWPMILSGLKTWLETGEPLTTPGSLMYGGGPM